MVSFPGVGISGTLDLADRFQELIWRTGLGQERKRRKRERLLHKNTIGMSGVNDNGNFFPIFLYAARKKSVSTGPP